MKKQYSKFLMSMTAFGVAFTGVAQVSNLGAGFQANSVSNNGTVIAGTIGDNNVIWTEANGTEVIGGITNGFPMAGRPTISSDGVKISATVTNPGTSLNEIGLYDMTTSAWTYLGGIGGQTDGGVSSAWSVSRDGSTVIGLGWVTAGNAHAVKWNSTDGMVDMGSTVANRSSRANDTNNDGSIIVGWQDATDGFRQGAVWANGTQTLITDQSDNPMGEAGAVSGNGNWVIGGSFDAWRWSENSGLIELESIFNASWRGSATSTNEDGSVIVGFYRPWPGPALMGQGFIWTEDNGMINLNDYVTSLGMDTQGITFSLPLGISNDGTAIVGYGLQSGNPVGFLIRLNNTPANTTCSNAIVLNCSDVVTGSTANATDNGGNASPDVFYSYTGSGTAEMITISLCNPNTNFNTVLRVFTSCDLTEEVAFNDNACDDQSEVSFESDGTSTYFIMIEGSTADDQGNYTLEITCEELMSTEEQDFKNLNFYPNPTSGILHINSRANIESIYIYNASGQLVLVENPNGSNQTINISSLQNGIYFAKAINKDSSKTIKIVKK